ncbi:MAG: hypothetical protein MRZ82_04515 [Firmicutes bacterium]|nr:hypothetical protein [Bacillota bacterium]
MSTQDEENKKTDQRALDKEKAIDKYKDYWYPTEAVVKDSFRMTRKTQGKKE